MANSFSSQYRGNPLVQNPGFSELDIAVVVEVILNINDITPDLPEGDMLYPEIDKGDYISKNGSYYGAIKFRKIGVGSELDEDRLPIAMPFNKEFLSLPVKDEIVKIHTIAGNLFYERLTTENSPNFSTNPYILAASIKLTREGGSNPGQHPSDRYNETNNVGISENNSTQPANTTIKQGFAGKYFKRNLKIHQLAMNEGDTLLQGRFGNSIRFSGYIHDDKDNGTQYPAILIRNGEHSDNQKKKVYDVVSEDVNKDGTSVQITSGKYKTLYDSTTIKVKKEANDNYPSSDQLIGDQIVVNSGRVILSSKTAETFLFSKKKFSIFTDDMVTIDTEKGINFVSQNGNITLKTKGNKNIFLDSSNGGNIFLGKNTGLGGAGADVQRMVLGGELVEILTQLIDAITQQSYATPVGPTATGPVNVATFKALQNRLKNILSARNYLSKS